MLGIFIVIVLVFVSIFLYSAGASTKNKFFRFLFYGAALAILLPLLGSLIAAAAPITVIIGAVVAFILLIK